MSTVYWIVILELVIKIPLFGLFLLYVYLDILCH